MKNFVLLFCFLLAACAKEKSESQGAPSAEPPEASLKLSHDFAHTEDASFPVLSAKATLALSIGQTITQADTEHCVQVEANRTDVEDLCLLLFTRAHKTNKALDTSLRRRALESQEGATALAWHPEAADGLSQNELLQTLRLLKNAPAGLRLAIAQEWATHNPSASLETLKPLLSEGDRPDTLRAYFGFWKKYDETYYQKELGRYCSENALGRSRFRCWRLMGYIGGEMGIQLHAQTFGNVADEDWNLFARVFTDLAKKIQSLVR